MKVFTFKDIEHVRINTVRKLRISFPCKSDATMEQETEFRTFETDLRLGLFPSRKLILERNKALSHARNPGLSKYGQCLVSVNTRLNNQLKTNLAKINAEFKRLDMQAKRKKNFFIKTSGLLNHEPLLLVQRPKSEPISEPTSEKIDDHAAGFMKPRWSKIVRPSSHKTIDIYTVQPTKKKNLWDNFTKDKTPRFTSVIRPCAKLSQSEMENLKNEYSATKPSLSFDKVSKAFVLSRSDLAPSSAKSKRLSGQMSPDSEQEESGKDNGDDVDDADDDDDDEYGLYKVVVGSESKTKLEESKVVHEPDEPGMIPASSSFITDIKLFDQITNENLQQNELNDEKHDLTRRQEDPSSGLSINEHVLSNSNSIKETPETAHRAIQHELVNPVRSIEIQQDTVPKMNHNNVKVKQYSNVSEHKRVEHTIALQTKGKLSKFNVAKAGILGKVAKAQPGKQLTRKLKPRSNAAAIINDVRKEGSIRKASAKSVKFFGL